MSASSEPKQESAIYHGTFIDCETPTKLSIRNGYIWVGKNGEIAGFAEEKDFESPKALIEKLGWSKEIPVFESGEYGFFFPGFIDTHIHAPQYPNSGLFGSTTLLDWLKTYTYPTERRFTSLTLAHRVYSTLITQTLSHGTTTAAYYATIHVPATNLLASICHSAGQRALIGRVCMDSPTQLVDYYRDESTAAALASTHEVLSYIKNLDPTEEKVVPILTPRSATCCTGELMSALGSLSSSKNLHIQTHLSENVDEIALVKKLFPDCDSYTEVYSKYGVLTPRTILAHCVHLSPTERSLLVKSEAKVSHCPVSNSALASGICPVRQLLDDGITVGLGTDVSGGYSPSILEATRQACLVSRLLSQREADRKVALSVEEALWAATRGGASVVGWHDRVGAFEVGMEWDAQLIELDFVPEVEGEGDRSKVIGEGNVKVFGWESMQDRVAKWVYCGDDRNTKKVWVSGRLVHQR